MDKIPMYHGILQISGDIFREMFGFSDTSYIETFTADTHVKNMHDVIRIKISSTSQDIKVFGGKVCLFKIMEGEETPVVYVSKDNEE